MAGIEFSGRQYEGSCTPEAMNSSAKGLMTLEESHFQVLKMPK
jgi:hypothetical protein